MYLHLVALIATLTARFVYTQNPSPCPETFSYEPRGVDQDRWYGVMSLKTAEDLQGVWLHVILDSPADILGNWFGETTSTDNTEFTIRNPKYKLEAGPPVSVRFFVKYNAGKTIPSLKTIRLNGKTICSSEGTYSSRPTPPMLHISKPSTKGASGRPESSQGSQERPSGSSRPSSGNSRPSGGSRPSGRPSGSNLNREPEQTRQPARPSFSEPSAQTRKPSRPNDSEDDDDEEDAPISYGNQRPSGGTSEAGEDDNDFFQGDFAIFNKGPPARKPPSRPVSVFNSQSACGTVASTPVPLISHGQNTSKGQWPWHAALYHSKGIQLMYICGGTLISENHIVTAAHCVTKPHTNRPVNKRYILVYLGKHDLATFGPEVQDRAIEEIFVHPEYDYGVYFNDIAILKLAQPVQVTKYIRPCCLWDEDTDLDAVVGKLGTVVGWGFDESLRLSNTLMQAKMPIIATVKCIYLNREFYSQFTSEKNYCAGYSNGTSVCNGDSGGGMVFPKKNSNSQNPVWQLRGIVSVGVALQGRVCNTTQPAIFTDVAKYLRWIKQTLVN